MQKDIDQVSEIILSEINVKKIEYISDSDYLTKKIKPNYKVLGPKYGKEITLIANALSNFDNDDIKNLEINKNYKINNDISISLSDVEITSSDIPGCIVTSNDGLTVARTDVTISKDLKEEGIAREFINRIQNIRKNNSFNVTDKINILVENNELLLEAIQNNLTYICDETLAEKLSFKSKLDASAYKTELTEKITANVIVNKNRLIWSKKLHIQKMSLMNLKS